MNFKRLTAQTGKRISVNFDLVTEIWPSNLGTHVYFGCSDGDEQARTEVTESVSQIMDMFRDE